MNNFKKKSKKCKENKCWYHYDTGRCVPHKRKIKEWNKVKLIFNELISKYPDYLGEIFNFYVGGGQCSVLGHSSHRHHALSPHRFLRFNISD